VLFIWLFQIRYKNKLTHLRDLFKDFQYLAVNLSPYLIDGLKLEVNSYPKEINEHLRDDAHKDVTETSERINVYIKLHNEEAREFYSGLQDDIINYIKQRNFIECDTSSSTEGQINFFNKESIKLDILRVMINSYPAVPESLSFEIRSYGDFNSLFCKNTSNSWILSDNERKEELKEIEKGLILIFNNTIRKFKFKLLLCYYDEIKTYQTSINKELKQIIDEIKIGTTPLKSKCSKCLKENVFGEINGNT